MNGYSHHSLDILTAHVGKDACAVTANAIVVMRASPGKYANNNARCLHSELLSAEYKIHIIGLSTWGFVQPSSA